MERYDFMARSIYELGKGSHCVEEMHFCVCRGILC